MQDNKYYTGGKKVGKACLHTVAEFYDGMYQAAIIMGKPLLQFLLKLEI